MDEPLPRSIAYDDVHVGDRLKITSTNASGTVMTTEMTVANINPTFVTDASGYNFYRGQMGTEERERTWELLDRPLRRGPAWDAEPLTFWREQDGTIVLRTQSGWLDAGSGVRYAFPDSVINELVPFSPPSADADLERLKERAIKVGLMDLDAGYGMTWTLAQCLTAIRDHQAGA